MANTIKVKVEADTEEAEGKFVKLQTRINFKFQFFVKFCSIKSIILKI